MPSAAILFLPNLKNFKIFFQMTSILAENNFEEILPFHLNITSNLLLFPNFEKLSKNPKF